MIGTFGNLLYHSVHSKDVIFVNCLYPADRNVQVNVSAEGVSCIVAVAHAHSHYAVLKINIEKFKEEVIVYDGIGSIELDVWKCQVKHVLGRCEIDPKEYLNNIRHHTQGDLENYKLRKLIVIIVDQLHVWSFGIALYQMRLMYTQEFHSTGI